MVLSLLPLRIICPSKVMVAELTEPECPARVLINFLL
jgi:hypothetical protein